MSKDNRSDAGTARSDEENANSLKSIQDLRNEFPEFKRLTVREILGVLSKNADTEIAEAHDKFKELAEKAQTAQQRKEFNKIAKEYELERLKDAVNKYRSNSSIKDGNTFEELKQETRGLRAKMDLKDLSNENKGKLNFLKRMLNVANDFVKGDYLSTTDRIRDNGTSLSILAQNLANGASQKFNGLYNFVKQKNREHIIAVQARATKADKRLVDKHDHKNDIKDHSLINFDAPRTRHAERTAENFAAKIAALEEKDRLQADAKKLVHSPSKSDVKKMDNVLLQLRMLDALNSTNIKGAKTSANRVKAIGVAEDNSNARREEFFKKESQIVLATSSNLVDNADISSRDKTQAICKELESKTDLNPEESRKLRILQDRQKNKAAKTIQNAYKNYKLKNVISNRIDDKRAESSHKTTFSEMNPAYNKELKGIKPPNEKLLEKRGEPTTMKAMPKDLDHYGLPLAKGAKGRGTTPGRG